MTVDIVVSTQPTRQYRVPAVLLASVGSEHVTLDQVYDVLRSEDRFAKSWANKILNGIERDRVREQETLLASIAYDPETYFYWGLTETADSDMIHALGRSPVNDVDLSHAETLSSEAEWCPAGISASTSHGVAMEPDLLAFTAAAFLEGCNGVVLAYSSPITFLEAEPLLAAGPPVKPSKDGLVYAIVDATDTTAVMDVIMLKPGPEAYRRDGGAWVLDNATLDALLSATPPPIVELLGETLSAVLTQVDGGQANQVSPNDDGSAEKGELLEPPPEESAQKQTPIKTKPIGKAPATSQTDTQSNKIKSGPNPSTDTYKSNQNKSQLKDGSSVTAALTSYHEAIDFSNVARSLAGDNATLDELLTAQGCEQRAAAVTAAIQQCQTLRQQIHVRQNIILPALTADAQSIHDSTPNQKKATHLRKYWVSGVGAVKIRWGTEGDFTRCERQLRKYLGAKAKGYCAKRHKETVGFWPGDKRNTGDTKGVTAAGPRKVKTLAGEKQYGQPRGSVIVKDTDARPKGL